MKSSDYHDHLVQVMRREATKLIMFYYSAEMGSNANKMFKSL